MYRTRAKIAIIDDSQDEVSLFINLMRRRKIKAELQVFFSVSDFLESIKNIDEPELPNLIICSEDLEGMRYLDLIEWMQRRFDCDKTTFVSKLSEETVPTYSGEVFYVSSPMTVTSLRQIIEMSHTLSIQETDGNREVFVEQPIQKTAILS